MRYHLLEGSSEKIFVAASIGPYGAYLSDGSEYHGNYNVSKENLVAFHKERIDILDKSKADFFACETIPSFEEAKILSNILITTKKQAWVSFSCKDEKHICDGTPISKCAQFLSSNPNIFALGANCTRPEYVSGLIRCIKPHLWGKKIVVYPNSGGLYNADLKVWTKNESQDLDRWVQEWVE